MVGGSLGVTKYTRNYFAQKPKKPLDLTLLVYFCSPVYTVPV